MEFCYPDEALSSLILRCVARGRLDPALVQVALDSEIGMPSALMEAMRRAGVSAQAVGLLTSPSQNEWLNLDVEDLHKVSSDIDGVGKGCEACLAEDVVAGRDHYIRLEWRFAWCISCRRHSRALVDLEAAELVPVVVDGEREYRVRFFREVDHIRDPFRRKLTRGSWPSGSFTALGICLEEDIRAALKGAELPDHWCLGRDWSQARAVLMDLADLLLTQAREGPQRLIHLLADGDLIPRAQASQFSRGCFTSMGAFWQRRLLEACARLLIDPNRFAHLEAGRQLNVHAELSYGRRNSHARARSVLARLAASDPLCLLLAYADEHQLLHFEERIRAWPTPLTNRMASAAAVAIYMV